MPLDLSSVRDPVRSRFHFAAGGGRFLKTLLCVHDEGGLVVVKVSMSLAWARQYGLCRICPPKSTLAWCAPVMQDISTISSSNIAQVYYKRGDVPGLDEQERRLADIRQEVCTDCAVVAQAMSAPGDMFSLVQHDSSHEALACCHLKPRNDPIQSSP